MKVSKQKMALMLICGIVIVLSLAALFMSNTRSYGNLYITDAYDGSMLTLSEIDSMHKILVVIDKNGKVWWLSENKEAQRLLREKIDW